MIVGRAAARALSVAVLQEAKTPINLVSCGRWFFPDFHLTGGGQDEIMRKA